MLPALCIALAGVQKDTQAQALMAAAQQKAAVQGDLKAAIKQYKDIADRFGKTDPAIAAMALVRMAELYQRIGDPQQSRRIYDQVVQQYGDQPEALRLANSAARSGPPAKRLLCSGCGPEGNVSRDGRSIVFTDRDSGDLAIRDLSTGRVKRLMVKAAGWEDNAFAELPVLSPDRRQIVYTLHAPSAEFLTAEHQLLLVSNDPGSKPRVLIGPRVSGDRAFVWAADWFPDGKSVVVTIVKPDKTAQLAHVSVSDGALTVLKPLWWRESRSVPRISPDGQYIVYSALAVNPSKVPVAPPDPKNVHIYILSADGSRETEIVKTAGSNSNPVWTADGKHILFTSDRSGEIDLWSIAVQNGKAVGDPSLVSPKIGDVFAVGMVGDSYYYGATGHAEYIHINEVNPGSGRPQAESFVGLSPAWSPDGKSIAFKRHLRGNPNSYDLVIHSIETGEETTPLAGRGTSGSGAPIWFHDGLQIMTGVEGFDDWDGFHRINLRNGEIKKLPAVGGGSFSPDDKTAYKVRPSDGKTPDRIMAIDLDSGQERQVFTSVTTRQLSIDLSPDGRTLALGWLDRSDDAKLHIARVSVEGSGFREVFTSPDRLAGGGLLAWGRDGRSILINRLQPGGSGRWEVMRVPADGGGPASLVFAAPGEMGKYGLSPDGSRFAYSTNDGADQLWALDRVLSVLK
jgi:Tol biopolymer transport system component